MDILRDFTFKNILLNKKRSIVTIIGIILSTALICTVAGMFYSFDKTVINSIIETDGDYHVQLYNVNKADLKYYKNNKHVKKYYLENELGYYLDDMFGEIPIYEFDQNSLDAISLSSGRLPKNNNEILVESDSKISVGETISLIYGDLAFDEDTNEISISNAKEGKYKVVGKFNGLYEYKYITYMEKINDNINIKLAYDNIRNTYKYTDDIKKKYDVSYHRDLLNWNFVTKSDETFMELVYFMLIIIGIIMISSIFVIRNSFEISTTEKMRQYGMLASIGATKKQIRKTVLYEGLFLGLVAIPLGILLGYIVIHILVLFTNIMFDGMLVGTSKFVVHIPFVAIILSVLTGALTILFSSLKSAWKAGKVSPIVAIRNNNEIKIKKKKLKTPKIINKLFGIGGVIAYKNLKRNKKKYRTTVISLIVSITIFIALYSFMTNILGVSRLFYHKLHFNMEISNKETTKSLDNYEKILKLDGIEKYMIVESKSIMYQDNMIYLYALNDKAYKELLNDLNLKYSDAKNKLLYMKNSNIVTGKKLVNAFDFKKNDKITYFIDDQEYTISVAKSFGENNYDLENFNNSLGVFIVSKDYLENLPGDYNLENLYIKAEDAYKLEDEIKDLNIDSINIFNYSREAKEMNNIFLWISVFLYGFIIVITLIGVTNIFNTITTNMNLRSKEFAMLKSIGMTEKEFNAMIRLESILYGAKSLLIGCTLGILLSLLIYTSLSNVIDLGYMFPYNAIIISIIFISLVVGLIMKYSLSKINKQNIIETIRRDNI